MKVQVKVETWNHIRLPLAVGTAKLISRICRLLGREGVTLSGKIACRICPQILALCAKQIREKIIVVCGTNGKTTTTHLLCTYLEKQKNSVVCNRTGSNMMQGITAAFVLACSWKGKLQRDYACLEVDEATARLVFAQIRPDYMILTNLFRDQLDRYGEIDIAMKLLKEAIQSVPHMIILVNGEDPLSYYLVSSSGNTFRTFGLAEPLPNTLAGKKAVPSDSPVRDGRFCRRCGAELQYQYYHYGQLGHYSCMKCGFQTPDPDYFVKNIKLDGAISFDLCEKKSACTTHAAAVLGGVYNIYNILSIFALLKEIPLNTDDFASLMQSYAMKNGRLERFQIGDTEIILNLAKNPEGLNQSLRYLMEVPDAKQVLIGINDNAADGKDISWLWDVEFENLNHESVESVMVCGRRCLDLQLRLKYADIPSERMESICRGIEMKLQRGCRKMYVLVNYTLLYKTRMYLVKLQEQEKQKSGRKIKDC